jgi:hypothetical protein
MPGKDKTPITSGKLVSKCFRKISLQVLPENQSPSTSGKLVSRYFTNYNPVTTDEDDEYRYETRETPCDLLAGISHLQSDIGGLYQQHGQPLRTLYLWRRRRYLLRLIDIGIGIGVRCTICT